MYSLDQLRHLLGRLRTRPFGSQMQSYPEMPMIRNDMPYGNDMNPINVGPKTPYGPRPPRVGPPYPDPMYGEDMKPFRPSGPTPIPVNRNPRLPWRFTPSDPATRINMPPTRFAPSPLPVDGPWRFTPSDPATERRFTPSDPATAPPWRFTSSDPATTRRFSPDGLTSYTNLPGGITQATSRNPAPELQTRSLRNAPQGARSHKIPPQVRGLKSYLDREG